MSELRIAIVGCGRMGRERARCARLLGARVATVFDIDGVRSHELASVCGAMAAQSIDECFASGLDALLLCTAPGMRGPVERECIARSLPFFVEKPIGTSFEQCVDLLSALESKPVLNGVGYMNRYRGTVLLACEILSRAETIGFSAHWVGKRYHVPWWQDEQFSGGPHNEQATHLFDLSRFLIGEVAEVESSFSGSSRAASLLRLETGVLGTAFYSCDGSEKDIGIRVFTTQGSLVLSGWDFAIAQNTIDGRLSSSHGEDIFLIETGAFLQAVRSGDQSLVRSSLPDAARTQCVLDAARQSGHVGHFVTVKPCGRSVLCEA
ncbi:MAG: Gfo/Idh/MocA family oxidoreductase [Acidobacteriota bacterium]|nr:Gfo/Idh/MocA family oxidoreductase [Acidobacteriota bacterium]